MRPLTDEEKMLISSVADRLEEAERIRLLDDLKNASACSLTPDGSRVMFHITGYQRPPYHGQHAFGVEGRMLDRDGIELSVLLYADENGRLLELEFIRWGAGDLLDPCWSTLKLQ